MKESLLAAPLVPAPEPGVPAPFGQDLVMVVCGQAQSTTRNPATSTPAS